MADDGEEFEAQMETPGIKIHAVASTASAVSSAVEVRAAQDALAQGRTVVEAVMLNTRGE